MQTYVINLSIRSDRMEKLAAQLADLGLPYTRIDAVDGVSGEDIGRPVGHPLSTPEYACYLSHFKALQAFLKTGDDQGLILEDDIVLSRNLVNALAIAPQPAPENTITRLEAPTNTHWGQASFVHRRPYHSQDGFRLYALKGRSFGSGAYLISRTSAQRFVAHMPTPNRPIDVQLFCNTGPKLLHFKVLQFEPALAIQKQFLKGEEAEDSDIVAAFENRMGKSKAAKPAYTKPFFNIYYNLRSIARFVILVLGFTRTFSFDDPERNSN